MSLIKRIGYPGFTAALFLTIAIAGLAVCEDNKALAGPNPQQTSSRKEPKRKDPAYDKLTQEKQELEENYAKLQKDNQAMAMDRVNLINQAKLLLADVNRIKDIEAELEAAKAQRQEIGKEKEDALARISSLDMELTNIRTSLEQLQQEKKKLEDMLSREKDKSRMKKLEEEAYELAKENSQLKNTLKATQSQLNREKDSGSRAAADREKFKEEILELRKKVGALNKDYAEAVRKNRLLEQKALTAPEKVSELARQNKTLIRQTANMHYNLGVFYTKNKEYSRAVAEFEEAVKLRPDDAYAHFNLGYIYAEYLVNRNRAIEHFRHYLRVVKQDDKDVDWVRKYILTWQAWEGKQPME